MAAIERVVHSLTRRRGLIDQAVDGGDTLHDPTYAIAGGFVEPRGMIRSVVGSVVTQEFLGGVAGAAVGGAGLVSGASPLRRGQIAYLGVFPQDLVLFKAKRGAFAPKQTTEVIAASPRTAVSIAKLERGRIAGVLQIGFADASTWAFDVPGVHVAGADRVLAALAQLPSQVTHTPAPGRLPSCLPTVTGGGRSGLAAGCSVVCRRSLVVGRSGLAAGCSVVC
jgi:hypothetical protein